MTGKLITATIDNFCAISDIGRSKVYELLDAGDLDSIKIGKRRLILLDSYRKLIERQRAAGTTTHGTETPSPGSQPIDVADAMAGRCCGTDAIANGEVRRHD
ncbi:MAG: helix-turn-helix domain-containing protein [Alphaproteobacteria bacterium]|nr:helix-turn-helix domain-containing protein [Alphaproteobacteria bacterium]